MDAIYTDQNAVVDTLLIVHPEISDTSDKCLKLNRARLRTEMGSYVDFYDSPCYGPHMGSGSFGLTSSIDRSAHESRLVDAVSTEHAGCKYR